MLANTSVINKTWFFIGKFRHGLAISLFGLILIQSPIAHSQTLDLSFANIGYSFPLEKGTPQSDPSILFPRSNNFTPPQSLAPNAMAVLPDGNAVMVGTTLANGGTLKQMALMGVVGKGTQPSGTSLFGNTAPLIRLTTAYPVEGRAVIVQKLRAINNLNSTYRILAVGQSGDQIIVARYMPVFNQGQFSLALDPFYHQQGIQRIPLYGDLKVIGLSINPHNQNIYIFGNTTHPRSSEAGIFLIRLGSDGLLRFTESLNTQTGGPVTTYDKYVLTRLDQNGTYPQNGTRLLVSSITFDNTDYEKVYLAGSYYNVRLGSQPFLMLFNQAGGVKVSGLAPSQRNRARIKIYHFKDEDHVPADGESNELIYDPVFTVRPRADSVNMDWGTTLVTDKRNRLILGGDSILETGKKENYLVRLDVFFDANSASDYVSFYDSTFGGGDGKVFFTLGDPGTMTGDQEAVGLHYLATDHPQDTAADKYVVTGLKSFEQNRHFGVRVIDVDGSLGGTHVLTHAHANTWDRALSSSITWDGRLLIGGETQRHVMFARYTDLPPSNYSLDSKHLFNDLAIAIQSIPRTNAILPTNSAVNYRIFVGNFGPQEARRVQVDVTLPLEIAPHHTEILPANGFCRLNNLIHGNGNNHAQYVVRCTIPLLGTATPNNIYWFDIKTKLLAIGENKLMASVSQESTYTENNVNLNVIDYSSPNNIAQTIHHTACINEGDICSSNIATFRNETCQSNGACGDGESGLEQCDLIDGDGKGEIYSGGGMLGISGPPIDGGDCYFNVVNGQVIHGDPQNLRTPQGTSICQVGRIFCDIERIDDTTGEGRETIFTLKEYACQGAVFPLPQELCNALDDDCDGQLPPNEQDSDGDKRMDCADNCPTVLNPGQEDMTPGGSGDACACGDGVLELVRQEQCDDGARNGAVSAFCTIDCKLKDCGDGNVDVGEQCDLGSNNRDDGACTLGCRNAVCGDRLIRDAVEECDGPGSFDPTTEACENCAIREYVCGDGKREGPAEECDDGNRVDDDRCANDCKRPPACADGRARQDVLCMGFEGDSRNSGQCLSVLDNGVADFFSMVTGFNGPAGFHMDRQKNVFLYDASQRVFRFDTQRGGESVWIAQSHRFQEIRDLDVDSKGDVWVLDGAQIFKILVGSNPTLSAANVPVMELVLSPSGLNIQAIELDDQDRLLALDDQSILYGFQPTGNGNTYQSDPSNRFDLKTAINASGNSLFDSNSFERGDMALTDGALIISNRLGRRSTRTAPPFYSVGLPLVTNSVVTTLDFMDLPGSIAYGSLDGQKRLFASGASPSNASRTRMTMAGEEILQGRSVPAQTVSNNEFSLLTDLAVIRSCPLTLKAPCIPDPLGERCDGRDNDCDGDIDESDPALDQTCVSAQPGICSEGRNICRNGALQCQPLRLPDVTDTCIDSLDNDCDGLTDENCECQPGTTQNCSTPCGEGIQTCLNGRWSNACQINRPNPELCDGQDNNCNGQVDETFDVGENCPDPIAISEQCFVPSAKACRTDAGGTECVAKPGLEPVCNIVDPSRCEGIVQKYGEQITVNEAINLVEDARQQKDPFSPSSNITYVVEGSFVTGECVNAGYQLGGGNKMLGCSLQRESGEVSKVLAFMMIGWSLLIAALRLRRRRQ